MAVNQKPASGPAHIMLTLVALLVCAGVSVLGLNLLGVSFFAASNSPTLVAGSAPPLARASATPTSEMEDLPPSPEPPTGTPPTPLPPPDIEQLKKLPTSTVNPNVPTPVIPEPPIAPPTMGHIEVITPDATWTTYTHPTLGFSFQYPSNWNIEVTDNPPPIVFTDIIIESYLVKGLPKGDKTPRDQLIKIEIHVSPEFEQYGDIDTWFEHYKTTQKDPDEPESNPIYPNFKHTQVAGVPAVRWFVPGPDGYTAVTFGKGKWLYDIGAAPGNSRYNRLFERLLSSFQIP